MDLITTAAIAYVTKDGIEKLLGPTFEYYGQELKRITEFFNIKAKENIKKIFGRAIIKKQKELQENGTVNARILKEIIFDGAFCDTNIICEYYAGILASSRTEEANDEGIHYINILKGLSSRQLKLHYSIYSKVFMEYQGKEYNLHESKDRRRVKVYFNSQEIYDLLEIQNLQDFSIFTSNDFPAIYHADLIDSYSFDTTKQEKQFEFTVSLIGVSLFLQALGFGEVFAPRALNDDKIIEIVNSIVLLNEL